MNLDVLLILYLCFSPTINVREAGIFGDKDLFRLEEVLTSETYSMFT